MGVATFAGRPFRLDPESVRWTFQSKTADVATVGGKIIQAFGTRISDMTVIGSFGIGGWQQQEAFLLRMKEVGKIQAHSGTVSNSERQPFRFTYPPKGWDFLVYLKAYTNPNGGRAIRHDPSIVNPKWQLTLFVVEDNSGLKRVAQDAYISRLAKGIGWKKTEFNGPLGMEALAAIVNSGGQMAPVPAGSVGSDPLSEDYRGMGNQTSDVERWQPLVTQYFPTNATEMLCIMSKESGGNPNAKNPTSSARGLFQIMSDVWAEEFGLSPNNLYHAETNVRIAREIYNRQGYKAWPNTAKACGLL